MVYFLREKNVHSSVSSRMWIGRILILDIFLDQVKLTQSVCHETRFLALGSLPIYMQYCEDNNKVMASL